MPACLQLALAESHNEAGIMAGFGAGGGKDGASAPSTPLPGVPGGGSPGKAAEADAEDDVISRGRLDSVDSSVTGGSDSEDASSAESSVSLLTSPVGGEDTAKAGAFLPTPVKAAPGGGEGGMSAAGGSPGDSSASSSPLDKAAKRAAHKAEMQALRERLRASKDGYGEDEGVCLNCGS